MQKDIPHDFSTLRKEAEEHLAKNKVRKNSTIPDGELLKLKHELQVHQIELEMQNEELIRTKNLAISEIEKNIDLYDFVPTGIITISDKGTILNLNHLAAKLLNNDRSNLLKTPFINYIHPKSILFYNQSFENSFKFNYKKTAELFLLSKTETPICVHIETIVNEDINQFSIALFDITDYKHQDELIRIKLEDLKEINNYFLCRELKLMDVKEEVNALLTIAGCEEQYLI